MWAFRQIGGESVDPGCDMGLFLSLCLCPSPNPDLQWCGPQITFETSGVVGKVKNTWQGESCLLSEKWLEFHVFVRNLKLLGKLATLDTKAKLSYISF